MRIDQPRRGLGCIAGMAVFLVVACASPIQTAHDLDPEADFTRYARYAWVQEGRLIGPSAGAGGSAYVSPIDDQRIRAAVDVEPAAKGYENVASVERTDRVVSYAIGKEEKTQIREAPGSRVYYPGDARGTWYRGSTVSVHPYAEGTLTIELWDRRSRQAVWVGWASKRLSRSDDSKETIREAVTSTLEPFPARVS